MEQRMSIFENVCICCGIKVFKEDKVYDQIELLVPNLYKNMFQLILEDTKLLEKSVDGKSCKNKAIYLNWLLISFFKDTRTTDHTDEENVNLIHVDRFLRFLHSNVQVWPSIMRELVMFIKMILGGKNVYMYADCINSIPAIANATANRAIAEFILSSPEYRDMTADALKEMGCLVLSSSFSKNFDSDEKELVKASLLFFVGFLDHWETQFYKHKLPSAGPTKHYFVTRVGVEKRFMASVMPDVARIVKECNVAADLLD